MNIREYELSGEEWNIFKHLRDVLKVSFLFYSLIILLYHSSSRFSTMQLFFFSRSTANIATVIPVMDHIDAHFATAARQRKYPCAIQAALAIGKKTLNRYNDKTDQSEIFRITMGM